MNNYKENHSAKKDKKPSIKNEKDVIRENNKKMQHRKKTIQKMKTKELDLNNVLKI
jgi:hypothetical protein